MFYPSSESMPEGSGADVGEPQADASALPAPRVVTTGRKIKKPVAVDDETGEAVEIFATGRGISVTRHLATVESVSRSMALIDAVAFSVVPPDEKSYVWVLQEMAQFLDLGSVEQRKGLFGFQRSARFGDGAGMVAWGGDSQRGRVYFSLMGKGCSMLQDWPAFAVWLEVHKAVIKRADVAYDDMEGKLVSIAWAVDQYRGRASTLVAVNRRTRCLAIGWRGRRPPRGERLA